MKKLLVSLFLGITLILNASNKVYITPKGKKYHFTKNCRTLKRSKVVNAISISKVQNRKPCKVCY